MRQPLVRAPEFVGKCVSMPFQSAVSCILLIALASSSAAGQSASADSAQPPSLNSAQILIDSGQLDAALNELDGIAAAKPSTVGLQYLRGMVMYRRGRWWKPRKPSHGLLR